MNEAFREAAMAQVDRVIAEWDEELREIEREAREGAEWHSQGIAVYYDLSGDLTTDDEGCLVTLCARHADTHHASVQHACDAEYGADCELCLEAR